MWLMREDTRFSSSMAHMVKTFKPVRTSSKSADVFETLRSAILSGKLQPGDVLRELPLARQLQVSQVPIREALLRLEHLGLVVRVADRSTTVTKLTRAEMIELLQVRAHLEELAFRLAVKHLDDAGVRELRDCLAKLEKKIEENDYFAVSDLDLNFHRIVWRLSQNQALEKMLERLCVSIYAFVSIKRHSAGENLKQSVNRHADLLEALIEGKPAKISAAIREHLDPETMIPASVGE